MTKQKKRLLLLQITDSVFPIGAYSHSYGLETYVQNGSVADVNQAQAFIRNFIDCSLTGTDLAAIRFAYEKTAFEDVAPLIFLEEQMNAARAAREIRQAGNKLATRFIKTAGGYVPAPHTGYWERYAAGGRGNRHQYAVSFGVFCSLCGMDLNDSITAFAYSQISAMVVNCVKLIPLSQTAGQNLLYSLTKDIIKAVETAQNMPKERFLQASPGFELRGMQHEGLYSRIYMS